ncbi:enoyl-CoA hydratase/isomerase family protein [Bradyrhizobium sp. LHD-71]|uniref:enoyl-CoA hydratase/isomerase family protein n=1 Tax=Bradyrhizobium sp. LHD-71 TaxID=3072141 RepID=UPI0028108040|nr:enoyl-CoA hydratase/isomerase family protein [Bradyrhizobium sp. LHD-71]MDQ8728190.1 enoyl-CoA hydratase/isomerase family protein [Bradyrhizobium sp. LHD-71]
MTNVLLSEDIGAVRRLTMNRPDKLNALNNELTAALLDGLLAADAASHINAVILTATGRGFCVGADVTEFKDMTANNPDIALARGALTTKLHAAFVQISVPVICAINGFAVGGGCGIAVAGDMAIACESAKFGYPEVKRGAVAAVVMSNLVRHVGRKMAYELVALGEHFSAEEARKLGLINRVVPDERLQAEALGIAQRIADGERHAQRATKRLFHRVADMKLLDALEIGRDANMIMRSYTIRGTAKAN